MTFSRRGPVTRENSIFHENGSVSCPLSTNKWTADEYFTIDSNKFSTAEGVSWHTQPQRQNGDNVLRIRAAILKESCPIPGRSAGNVPEYRLVYLHQLLFHVEMEGLDLVVDHVLHWLDNRRASVDFITQAENTRRGAALFHHGKRNRRRQAV